MANCKVIKKPPRPWPSTLRTCSERRAWIKANPEAWNTYRKSICAAYRNGNSYMPYDKAKCDKAGGRKSMYAIVPFRYAFVKEVKKCD